MKKFENVSLRVRNRLYKSFVATDEEIMSRYLESTRNRPNISLISKGWILLKLKLNREKVIEKPHIVKPSNARSMPDPISPATSNEKPIANTIKSNDLENTNKVTIVSDSESMQCGVIDAYRMAQKLMKYDVISFDVFDTLIFRPFSKPQDLFLIVQQKLDYLNFANIRVEMERKAKDLNFALKGNREVVIDDIYTQIERYTGIDKNTGINVEFNCEKELCAPNPYMKRVFDILRYNNKTIIATSDMYYPHDMLKDLLKSCGYDGFSKIFVSCDYGTNKTKKGLFKIVKSEYTGKIVHIGDNYVTDIKNARSEGFDAIHYKNVNEVGTPRRARGLSPMIGSAYSGIVNSHLLNGVCKFTPQYEYGFVYGGLFVLGYCAWIHDHCINHNVDKVLFISRDGAIYQKVFNMLYKDVNNQYMYWSRLASAKLVSKKDRYDFILRIARHRKNDVFPITIGSLLGMFDLEFLFPILTKYQLTENMVISDENIIQVENFIIDNWADIESALNNDVDASESYFRDLIGDAKNVAVVDIGWQGSGLLGIKWLVEERWGLNCKVHCLLAGSKALSETANQPNLLDGTLKVYSFSISQNRMIYDYFAHANNHTNTGHFELFSQAQSPTFNGLKKDKDATKMTFGLPEVENYEIVSQIHSGIFDFCSIWAKTFEKYPFMYNISGYDAFLPFRHITHDPHYFHRVLGKMTFSRNIVADFSHPYLETVDDILIKQKMIGDEE